MDFLKKIYNYILRYKIVITFIISTVLYTFSTLWYPLTFVNGAFLTLIFILSPVNEILYYLLYFMLFSRNTIFFVLIAVTAFLTIMFKFINAIINGKMKISKMPLILTTIICLVFGLINYSIKFEGLCIGLLIIGLLFLGYILFCYRKEINVDNLFKSLFFGILASTLVSVILYYTPSAEIMFYDTDGFYLRPVKDMIFMIGDDFDRLMLLSYSPNHLNCYCIFIICNIMHKFINEEKIELDKIALYLAALGVCLIVGILTISKAFLISSFIAIGYGLFFLMIKRRKESLKFIIPIIITGIIIVLLFNKSILSIFDRFYKYGYGSGEGGGVASNITTGRTNIWKKYFEQILSTPWKLLFGHGIFASEVVAIGAHNLYISILYRFGIVGILALIGLLVVYYLECKNLKFSLYKFLTLFVFLIYSLQEVCIDERFIFLILSFMLLFDKNNTDIIEIYDKNDIAKNKESGEILTD